MMSAEAATILLVEDDPGHARLIEKNLRRAHVDNEIVLVSDGQRALDYVLSEGEHAGSEPPEFLLVLLDLNLPVLDGYQVLQRLKADERTRRIPVIVVTTADDDSGVSKCYELGCNAYITKPVDYTAFSEAIHQLGLFLPIFTIPTWE
jgi:CheY-like chemotaxis protein